MNYGFDFSRRSLSRHFIIHAKLGRDMEYSGLDTLLGCLTVSWLCVSNITFASKVNLFDLQEFPLPRKKPSSQNGRRDEAGVVCSNV